MATYGYFDFGFDLSESFLRNHGSDEVRLLMRQLFASWVQKLLRKKDLDLQANLLEFLFFSKASRSCFDEDTAVEFGQGCLSAFARHAAQQGLVDSLNDYMEISKTFFEKWDPLPLVDSSGPSGTFVWEFPNFLCRKFGKRDTLVPSVNFGSYTVEKLSRLKQLILAAEEELRIK